jgi:hypothetical protein
MKPTPSKCPAPIQEVGEYRKIVLQLYYEGTTRHFWAKIAPLVEAYLKHRKFLGLRPRTVRPYPCGRELNVVTVDHETPHSYKALELRQYGATRFLTTASKTE